MDLEQPRVAEEAGPVRSIHKVFVIIFARLYHELCVVVSSIDCSLKWIADVVAGPGVSA